MKKIISILLSSMMVMCFMPTVSYASDTITSLNDATMSLSNNNVTYSGDAQVPTMVLTASGGAIIPLSDISSHCIVEYSTDPAFSTTTTAIDAGTYYVKVTAKDADTAYNGSISTGSFVIKKANLSSVTQYEPISVVTTATDDTIKAAVKLKLGNHLLESSDWRVEGGIPDHTTPGAYTFTITGAGLNFEGSKSDIRFASGSDISDYYMSTTPDVPSFTFDGLAKTFSSVVIKPTAAGLNLVEGADYIKSYDKNINANVGQSKLIITGIGKYAGKIEKNFSIGSRAITGATMESLGNVAYLSDFSPKLTFGSYALKEGSDFAYSRSWNTTTKKVTITATGLNGNFTGSISKEYGYGAPISAAIVTCYPTSVEYTGQAVSPTYVYAKIGSTNLYQNTHFVAAFSNNINVGSLGKITITGIGDYGGQAFGYFTITARTIKASDITLTPNTYAYDGTAKRPVVSVYSGGRTLKANVDYTVQYNNNVNPGTASAIVTGMGNYTGVAISNFSISGTDINSCIGSLSQSSYNYTGYSCNPVVTVKKGSTTLINGTDYTVAYTNNIYAGTATATITGKGSYSGTMKLTYTINGKSNCVVTPFTKYTRYLTSDPFKISASSVGDETGFSFVSSDTGVATVSAAGVVTIVGTGKATITISTVGTKTYDPATKTITITVKPSKVTPKLYSTSKGKLKVRVTKATGVTKYQIRYGRAGSYKSYYMSYANNSFTTQSMTFSKLKSGYKYYVKVRPYKLASDGTKVYGNWSSTKSIRIK